MAFKTGRLIRIFCAMSAKVGGCLTIRPTVYVLDSTNARTYSKALHVSKTFEDGTVDFYSFSRDDLIISASISGSLSRRSA